jgi:radical SAM protein with 4Fe4S-binding SPASM domain
MKVDWRRLFGLPQPPQQDPAAGVYPFARTDTDPPARLHLRVDPDGGGLLWANASEAAVLSPVGVVMAHGVLSGLGDAAVAAQVRARFRGADPARVNGDLAQMRALIADLTTPNAAFPVTAFGAGAEGAGRRLAAPHRAHLGQTDPDTTKALLQALWKAGVPHVTFHPDLQRPVEELPRLVEAAEDLGMLAGLRTLAGQLPDAVLQDAAQAGLDYLVLPVASCDATEHDALMGAGDHEAALSSFGRCLELELCPVAQLPILDSSAHELDELVRCVSGAGVANISVFALACLDGEEQADAAGALPARALPQVAALATECADHCNVRLTWEPPIRCDLRRSLANQVCEGPRASGDVSVRVEPDGSVFPPRGPRSCGGNLLQQPWEQIWQAECFRRYREGTQVRRCSACPGLELCEAGCVKDPDLWSNEAQEGDAQ